MTFKGVMDAVASGFEALGATVLVVGFGVGFVRAGVSMLRGAPGGQAFRWVRSFVGRTILLGLEVLVAADLIRTVAVDPSWQSVGVLAVIVVIRTFLSFSLEIEIDGRLPWDRGTSDAGGNRAGGTAPTKPMRLHDR